VRAKNSVWVARQPVTFLLIPYARKSGAMRCLCLERPSGCVVVIPDRFRLRNWPRFRIGGALTAARSADGRMHRHAQRMPVPYGDRYGRASSLESRKVPETS
jgi:hypothetical protein